MNDDQWTILEGEQFKALANTLRWLRTLDAELDARITKAKADHAGPRRRWIRWGLDSVLDRAEAETLVRELGKVIADLDGLVEEVRRR